MLNPDPPDLDSDSHPNSFVSGFDTNSRSGSVTNNFGSSSLGSGTSFKFHQILCYGIAYHVVLCIGEGVAWRGMAAYRGHMHQPQASQERSRPPWCHPGKIVAWRGVEWRRIGDICTNPRLVKNGVGRHDVIQVRELCCGQCHGSGSVGSVCFLASSIQVQWKVRLGSGSAPKWQAGSGTVSASQLQAESGSASTWCGSATLGRIHFVRAQNLPRLLLSVSYHTLSAQNLSRYGLDQHFLYCFIRIC